MNFGQYQNVCTGSSYTIQAKNLTKNCHSSDFYRAKCEKWRKNWSFFGHFALQLAQYAFQRNNVLAKVVDIDEPNKTSSPVFALFGLAKRYSSIYVVVFCNICRIFKFRLHRQLNMDHYGFFAPNMFFWDVEIETGERFFSTHQKNFWASLVCVSLFTVELRQR